MNKIAYKSIYSLLVICAAVTINLSLPACKKNLDAGAPVISEVRNYEASPNDTIIQTIKTGQWVVLTGHNFSGVTHVYFGSIPATINNTLFTNESIVAQVPAIPFDSVERDRINVITVVSATGTAAYNINITGPPIISYVRENAAAPNDTIINALLPGQTINLIGYNLKNATKIAFQGIEASLADVIFTDSSAIVQVPTDLSGADASLANMISYTTIIGTGTFSIQIIGPPIITNVSCENPNEGDSVYLYGNNFFSVQSLTFAGAAISSYKASDDGASLGFVAPAFTESGPVVITTAAGNFTSAYNVNDIATGAISNFEWSGVFNWEWWGGANLECGNPSSGWPPYNANFPGNTSQYLVLKNNPLDGGAGDEWGNAIRIPAVQWIPAGKVSDPVNNWALKFEIYIPNPWKGGTLCIKSSNGTYMSRYEPWQISPSFTAPYSTKGWLTVSIPFSSFRKNDATLGDGKGAPITAISDIIGSDGKSALVLYMHNYSSAPAETSFNAAFDNFRVTRR